MTEDKGTYLATQPDAQMMEQVLIGGDLSRLSPQHRVVYYKAVCDSVGLNPLTKPFEYITLNGKLTLYARKDATDQLRKLNSVSITKPDIAYLDDWIVVTVEARDNTGRTDSDVGVVNRKDMRGDFGNAVMKAVTKAKRRVTLSICGLGMLDETEIETIPDAQPVPVDVETGEIVDAKPEPAPKPHAKPLNRKAAIEEIERLRSKAQSLSDGRQMNDAHLANHLEKHYGVRRISDLSDADLILFGKHLRGMVAELEAQIPEPDPRPEDLQVGELL